MTESEGNAGNDSAKDRPNEAEVLAILKSLPSVTMPEDVQARIMQALADEPNPYAVTESATTADRSTTNVTSINSRAQRRSRWLVGLAGVAAVGVLGVVVGSTVWTETETQPITASVVPMSQSGTVYQKDGLATQVKQALPTWRSASNSPATASPTLTATQNTTTSAPSASQSALPGSDSVVATTTRDQISRCLQRVDARTPMHVDIAAYREAPLSQQEPVAVAVVPGDGSVFDVYVLDMACIGSIQDIVREHFTVTEPTP